MRWCCLYDVVILENTLFPQCMLMYIHLARDPPCSLLPQGNSTYLCIQSGSLYATKTPANFKKSAQEKRDDSIILPSVIQNTFTRLH